MNTKSRVRRSRRLAEILGKSIETGKWTAGARLPSCRALAGQFGVSVNTVQLALRELEARNLLDRGHGRKSVVKSPTSPPSAPQPARGSLVGVISPMILSSNPRWSVFPDDYWITTILRAAEQALFDTRLTMVTLPSIDEGEEFLPKLRARLDHLGHELGGAICFTQSRLLPALEEFDRRGIKWLTIGRASPTARHNFVAADNQGVCRLVGKALALSEHHRLWILCGRPQQYPAFLDQVTGLYQGFLEIGVSPKDIELIPVDAFDEMTGYQTLKARLEQGAAPPQAIFAGDQLIRGACQALREAGHRIPDDVALVSSGAHPNNPNHDPPLTTITQPTRQMGLEAGAMLGHMIREDHPRIAGRWIDCELVFRQSLLLPDGVKRRIEAEQQAILNQPQVGAAPRIPEQSGPVPL